MGHVRKRAWPVLVLAALIAAPVAEAAKRPPRATLHAAGESVRLGPYSYGWMGPQGRGECVGVDGDGVPNYAPRMSIPHRHGKPRVVLHRDRRPRIEDFRAHRALTGHGSVAGRGKRVRARLFERRRGGEVVAWVIAFRVDVVDRPYFRLELRYPERGSASCPSGGYADYGFGIARE